MTGDQIITAIKAGFTLHSSRFGFWLICPYDGRCTNVHNGAAKALIRHKRIKKTNADQWELNPPPKKPPHTP